MDRNFFTNDFESLLKENADQFKMYPSKKVWHGIYNDMHPGRKWPSIAMSLFLVFTLVIVGRLNIQKFEKAPLAAAHNQELKDKTGATNVSQNISERTSTVSKQSDQERKKKKLVQLSPDKANANTEYKAVVKADDKLKVGDNPLNNIPNSEIFNKRVVKNSEIPGTEQKGYLESENSTPNNKILKDGNFENLLNKATSASPVEILISSDNDENLKNTANVFGQETKAGTLINNPNLGYQINKSIRLIKHRSNKIRWAYYFTPSISYRILSKEKNNLNLASSYYSNVNDYVDHTAAPGFEAGTVVKYSLNKKFKFTSGLQLSYSAYNIQANNIHPMLATLMVNNSGSSLPTTVSGISFFSNGSGFSPTKLHNYSFQASVPVGFEYIISENDYLQLSAAANFQPSYIISNHSYLLSSDKRNYLTHPSLLRKYNMNTSTGLFVTFKSKRLDLQIGPEIRYQLLSTYKKAYPVNEHLINYGIRFSVSKPIN